MNTRSSSRPLVALFLAATAIVGCNGGSTPEDIDEATQEISSDGASAIQASDESTAGLTDATFEAASADPAAAADALVATPGEPVDGKCRSRAKDPTDPSTVIITLTDCTGRFGKRHVSGQVIVHFTQASAGVLHADFQSQGLTVDGRPATHTASADITFDGQMRHVDWQGAWSSTNAAGDAVSHTSDLTIDVDKTTHCRTRNGTAQTTVGNRGVDTSIRDLQVCRSQDGDASCPTGTVVHTRKVSGKTVTVSFDGSDQATVTTSKGATFEKQLACEP